MAGDAVEEGAVDEIASRAGVRDYRVGHGLLVLRVEVPEAALVRVGDLGRELEIHLLGVLSLHTTVLYAKINHFYLFFGQNVV